MNSVFKKFSSLTCDEIKTKLMSKLPETQVERVILFGSYATGQSDIFSDVDLVFIAETNRPFIDRFRDYEWIFEMFPAVELLIYTPKEYTRLSQHPTGVFYHIINKGKILYERPSC
jgi:predicted nucleotidyltransferase